MVFSFHLWFTGLHPVSWHWQPFATTSLERSPLTKWWMWLWQSSKAGAPWWAERGRVGGQAIFSQSCSENYFWFVISRYTYKWPSLLYDMAVNSQQLSFLFMIQELTVDEEEPPDSSFQCLKFLLELFTLPVSAKGEKKSLVCSLYFKCFSRFKKICPFFFRPFLEGLGNRDDTLGEKGRERKWMKGTPSLRVRFACMSPLRGIFALWWLHLTP